MLRLSLLTLIRQPARTALAILGVAAVGALLFDMLLLSRGLVLSFRDLLDRAGFDVRVLATDAPPFTGPRIPGATLLADKLSALPEVEAVLQLRVREADFATGATTADDTAADRADGSGRSKTVEFVGVDPRVRPMWTLVSGKDLPREGSAPAIVVNRNVAGVRNVGPGGRLVLRG